MSKQQLTINTKTKEMKLISMTDFVLQNKTNFKGYKDEDYGKFAYNHVVQLENYANFLRQPLSLGMFIPCDKDGHPLEEPEPYEVRIGFDESDIEWNKEELEEYIKANEKVLFEGFVLIYIHNKRYKQALVAKDKEGKGQFDIYNYETIEDLVFMDLTLTPNAIKQLGL